jgi:NifU-like protein involved in Fe-S cluster formation
LRPRANCSSISAPCSPARKTPTTPLGKLVSLAGVRQYPSRIKCALLGWHALMHAIAGNGEPGAVTTEKDPTP